MEPLRCPCGASVEVPAGAASVACPACASVLPVEAPEGEPHRHRRHRHSARRGSSLSGWDWIVCMLLPPLGVLAGLLSIALGNWRRGLRRLGVSALSLAIIAMVKVVIGLAA